MVVQRDQVEMNAYEKHVTCPQMNTIDILVKMESVAWFPILDEAVCSSSIPFKRVLCIGQIG